MIFTSHNLVAWHDRTTANHVAERDKFADLGYRPLSISVYATPGDPRYAAVMVKRPNVIATKSVINKTQGEYQKVFEDMANDGFGPFLISATGPKNSAIFAGSFRQMAHIPLTRSNLSQADFIKLNAEQHDKGAILMWADVFGSADEPRYCAIWGPNTDHAAWNIDAVDERGDALQQRFLAMRGVGARPAVIAVTPSNGIMELFVDSHVASWSSKVGMTSAGYQDEFEAQAKLDRWPVCVSASGSGDNARFAAIFASSDDVSPRTYRVTGSPAVAAIDTAMETYVRAQKVRGVALALIKNRRLIYAKGYTNAEASYANIQPTTPFRQASISKTFCAVAIWKLIQDQKLTLETTLQSVLNLKQPDGSAPKDAAFADVKIKHLLTSTSGIPQGGVWHAVDASTAFGGTLPSNGNEVARWITTLDLTGTPGDRHNTVYGNTDYFLLSLVVAKKMNAATFEAALKTLVLDPLHMTRTRGSRSLTGSQHDDEARYHMTVHDPEAGWALFQLECGSSTRTDGRPLVPTHYGTFDIDMFDGCGGLSSAVVDVARLCAMFACRANNPVLTSDTIDDMLAAAVSATGDHDGPDAHGYHGFDSAKNINLADHQVRFKKGGWLPGMGTSYVSTSGAFGYVLAKNGNTPAGLDLNWYETIRPIVEAHDWGTGDLFPTYGMPTLTGLSTVDPVVMQVAETISLEQTVRQVQASMGRSRIMLRPR